MKTHFSADETRQEHINRMGAELGPLYNALYNEVGWLHFKWAEYVVLFGTKPSRVELLNNAAPRFFRMVEDALWEDTLLHISRLVDSPKSAGKEKLSLLLLIDTAEQHLPENVAARVRSLADTAREKAEFCRDWRNRHIAHRDLDLALRDGARPLAPASRAKIKEALAAIAAVMNAFANHFLDTTVIYDHEGSPEGAIGLLYLVNDGLLAERARAERARAGNSRADDFEMPDL